MAQRHTMQKDVIYAALTELHNHPTADMVYDRVHTEFPKISRATVFRVLRQMAENGQVRKVSIFDGADCFDHNLTEHCHARCSGCHGVFDVFLEKPLVESLLRPDSGDFYVTDYSLELKGFCHDCMRRKQEAASQLETT